jgi:hypothetical protein
MKTLLLFLFMISTVTSITAQQVVASSGNTATAGGYTVDWTLGEPVIETISGSNNILTQGMHQPNLVVTSLQDLTFPGLEVKVYPNPTGRFLRIEVIQTENDVFHYELSDITGRRILMKKMQAQSEEIDMSSYVSGTYLLQVLNSRLEHVKVCKIIKN